jgi:hypothetical protein
VTPDDSTREMDRRNQETHRRGQELAELHHHWGSAYRITWQAGQFVAERRDDGASVRKATAADLLAELRLDYAVRPVPR